MKTKLTNRKIRDGLRGKGIPVKRTILGARFNCRRRYWKHGNPQWAFAENYGLVILDKITVQAYNHGRMKNGMKKLRVRDMDRMAIFRYPRIGWFIKNPKKKTS